jgi:hypothetical protein
MKRAIAPVCHRQGFPEPSKSPFTHAITVFLIRRSRIVGAKFDDSTELDRPDVMEKRESRGLDGVTARQ